jgi:hypothetical protein
MTWRLGLKYIWIDSLCIVQDDIEDWRREGSNMASIYSRSYLTLAATSSTNCEGGFYTPNTSVTQIPDHGGLLPSIFVRKSVDHRPFFENKLPLMSRAWVFQERMLSLRTVQFTTQELVWECTTTQSCECGACSEDEWNRQNKSQYDWLPIFQVAAPQQRAHTMRDQWYNIVNQYTNLNLTFRKDIFPALQGVTKRMEAARKCRCLAGIWEDSLPEDLLWSCARSADVRAETYWAPSWSWASYQGEVSWPSNPNHLSKVHIEVVSASVTPAAADPTGELVAGELVLRGKTNQVSVDISQPLFPWVVPLRDSQPDSKLVPEFTPLSPPSLRKTNDGRTSYWHKCAMDIALDNPFEVTLLHIGDGTSYSYFLILSQVRDAGKKGEWRTFERVGVAWYRGRLNWFDDVDVGTLRIV